MSARVQPAAGQTVDDVRHLDALNDQYMRLHNTGKYQAEFEVAQQYWTYVRARRLPIWADLMARDLVSRAHLDLGQFREAIELYERIVADAEPWRPENDAQRHIRTLLIGNGLRFNALCHERLAEIDKAIELYKQSIEFLDRNAERISAAEARGTLSFSLLKTGDPQRAMEQLKLALPVLEQAARTENPPDHIHVNLANVFMRISGIQLIDGRFDLAESNARRAIQVIVAVRGWNHPETAAVIKNLADLLWLQNRNGEAEALYRFAVGVYESTVGLKHLAALETLNSLGELLIGNGHTAEAEPMLRQVVELRRELLGENHPELAGALVDLSKLLINQKRYADADSLDREALAICERNWGPLHSNLAEPLYVLGLIREAQGAREDALTQFDRVLAIHRNSPLRPGAMAWAMCKRADQFWSLARRDEALEELAKAIHHAELQRGNSAGAERERAILFGGFDHIYSRLVDWRAELGDTAGMFAAVEAMKARSFLDELNVAKVDLLQGLDTDKRKQLGERDRQLRIRLTDTESRYNTLPELGKESSPQLVEQHKAAASDVAAAQNALYQHLAEVRETSPVYRKLISADSQTVSLADVQQKLLDSDGLLLSYQMAGEHPLVMIVQKAGVEFARLEVDEAHAKALGVNTGPLTSEVLSSILLGENGVLSVLSSPKSTATVNPKLLTLWEVLVPKAQRDALTDGSIKLLTVLPDGPLALLPFEVLVVSNSDKPQYLLDAGPPTIYAPSASVLGNLADRPRKSDQAKESLLTLGDPLYQSAKATTDPVVNRLGVRSQDQQFRGSLKRLPYSGWEANWVDQHFKKQGASSVKLIGAQATEAQLRSLIPGRQIVHLACHGMADKNYGNFFGSLAVAPGNAKDPGDDGFLYASEICKLDLSGCELAILSACQTNYGPQQTGEGVWSLSRAFLVAGARRVVASNWVVDDEAGATLVSHFAAVLSKADANSRDYATALQLAKRKVRQQDRWSNPFYWGSLVLVGPN